MINKLFGDSELDVELSRAMSFSELSGAYRLVHDMFVEKGYLDPSQTQLRLRTWEASPHTATFIAKHKCDVIGVTNLVVDSSGLGLPLECVFSDEMAKIRKPDSIICEFGSQAIVADWKGTAVTTELMRCLYAHALSLNCTDIMMVVSPNHARFYKYIGFVQISDVVNYSKKDEDLVVLMHGANASKLESIAPKKAYAKALRRQLTHENPYRTRVAGWAIEAEEFFKDPHSLYQLFVKCGMLENYPERQLSTIRNEWGDSIFSSASKD